MTDTPPRVLYQVIEAKVWEDTGLEVHAGQVFPDEDAAEHEAEERREAWETALAEWEADREEDPGIEAWTIDVQEVHVTDRTIDRAARMATERYEKLLGAASAVGYSLINNG